MAKKMKLLGMIERLMRSFEHPNQDALNRYLKNHPLADKSLHTIKRQWEHGGGTDEILKPRPEDKSDRPTWVRMREVLENYKKKNQIAGELMKIAKGLMGNEGSGKQKVRITKKVDGFDIDLKIHLYSPGDGEYHPYAMSFSFVDVRGVGTKMMYAKDDLISKYFKMVMEGKIKGKKKIREEEGAFVEVDKSSGNVRFYFEFMVGPLTAAVEFLVIPNRFANKGWEVKTFKVGDKQSFTGKMEDYSGYSDVYKFLEDVYFDEYRKQYQR